MSADLSVIVSSSIFPNREEPVKGVYIFQQARALSRHCTVRVVAPVPYFPRALRVSRWRRYARIPLRETIGGLDVHHPRVAVTPGFGRCFYGLWHFLGLLPLMRRLVRESRPAVLLSFWAYPDGFANVLLARVLGLPVIVGGRGCDINTAGESAARRIMVAWALKGAARVLAVSEPMKRTMVGLGVPAGKIVVIPNGLDERFLAAARELVGQEVPARPPGPGKTILYCGRLSAEKGLGFLVSAAALLRERRVPFRLSLVGDGPERAALAEQVRRLGLEEDVSLVGEVPHEDVVGVLKSANVFCLPSLREGCPNVVLEALACGVPVVGSAVGGIPELVNSPDLGLLVPAGDPVALAAALAAALEKDWDRVRIAGSVADRSWDGVARRLMQELLEVRR